MCELVQEGVVVIFGPQRKKSLRHVHSMCDAMGIPHISTTLNTDDNLKVINIYPHSKALSMVNYHLFFAVINIKLLLTNENKPIFKNVVLCRLKINFPIFPLIFRFITILSWNTSGKRTRYFTKITTV